MKKTFQTCFKKVRVKSGNRKPLGDQIVQENLKVAENLKGYLAGKTCKEGETWAKRKLEEVESKINLESYKKNANIVKDHVASIQSFEGSFCNLGFWKLKEKLWPEAPDPPMAKKDVHGNLLTSPDGIKNLYLQTYSKRLENRQMDPKFLDMYFLKMELWDIRSNNLRYSSSTPWTFKDLEQSIKKLKKNKARDPLGMTNEIFMDGYIGQDLKNALLLLMNGIKEHKIIPDFIKLSNITSIYKQNNKSRYDIENDRGIFILTAIRKLLDNLIYNDKFPYIDRGMTDSNIGARKERNIKDHLFILHGIINSVVKGDDDCIDRIWA